MAFTKNILIFVAVVLTATLASAAPGGWHGSQKRVIIHVPYDVHTVHHHYVKKVHVPVPVVKKIYVHEEPYHYDWW